MLNVSEIFLSLQGESAQCGRLCSFVRLNGCNLRCAWCDTLYARAGAAASAMPVDDVIAELEKHYSGAPNARRLAEVTGGEPLLQPEAATLCGRLLELGYEVMAETNGSRDISALPEGVRRIVDVKCPGSGEGGSFLRDNINRITPDDELKFVLASIDDAVWARQFCERYGLTVRCPVTFSPAAPLLPYNVLAEWMVENRLADIRLGIQLHKVIWGDKRGV
jgi:7-carboxy-7-deazaguanine synthase